MPTYREVTLSAKSDEEANELVAKEFHKDPYMYPIKSDMKDLPKRMFRITYEIEGGKTYELKTEDPPGHEQIQKLVLDHDKPCIAMVKQVKDLNNKIFLWNVRSDKEYCNKLKNEEILKL